MRQSVYICDFCGRHVPFRGGLDPARDMITLMPSSPNGQSRESKDFCSYQCLAKYLRGQDLWIGFVDETEKPKEAA